MFRAFGLLVSGLWGIQLCSPSSQHSCTIWLVSVATVGMQIRAILKRDKRPWRRRNGPNSRSSLDSLSTVCFYFQAFHSTLLPNIDRFHSLHDTIIKILFHNQISKQQRRPMIGSELQWSIQVPTFFFFLFNNGGVNHAGSDGMRSQVPLRGHWAFSNSIGVV